MGEMGSIYKLLLPFLGKILSTFSVYWEPVDWLQEASVNNNSAWLNKDVWKVALAFSVENCIRERHCYKWALGLYLYFKEHNVFLNNEQNYKTNHGCYIKTQILITPHP